MHDWLRRLSKRILFASLILANVTQARAQSTLTANDLFNGGTLQELRLEINPKDWKALKDNPGADTYYPADLTWGGVLVENVGIRQRGGSTRNRYKPGLRVDFNRYEAGQEFLGLKSLGLDNMAQDASMMKERVSMAVYSKIGLPAAREVNARLYVNDEYAGLYTLIEPVDKNFLKRVFGENDGYLYEYASPTNYHFEYLGTDIALYSPRFFEPKTHEADPDPRPIEAMIRTMNLASDTEFPKAMEPYLDLPAFMKHLAVEDFLGERDGILAGMNNFYLYRFEKKTLSQFIAKDKDLTFGGPPVNSGGTRAYTPLLANASVNVLIRRSMAVPAARQAYFDTLNSLGQLSGAGGWLESEITRIYNQIRDAARSDTNKQCYDGATLHACTDAMFESEVAANLEFARERGKYVAREIDHLAADRLFAISANGGMSLTMTGVREAAAVGYAVIDPDTVGPAAEGIAVFSYETNGVIVTETSVPASAPVQRAVVYAEINGGAKTGLALANPSDQDIVVSFFYTDTEGKTFGSGSVIVKAEQQIARFVDQPPFNTALISRATITLDSSSPIFVTALRGLTNERGEFLVSTLPVVQASDVTAGTAMIPHFADGGGWSTQIVLINPTSESLQGSVEFTGSTSSYVIPAGGHWRLQTSGAGTSVRSGAVRIVPSGNGSAPAAFGVFAFRKDGITVSEAAIQGGRRAAAYRMYAEFTDSIQTGIAIANPGSQPLVVSLETTMLSGAQTSHRGTLTVPPNGQIAAFLNQISGFQGITSPFQGIVRISAAAGSEMAVGGLRGRYNSRGDFLIATIPAIDESAVSPQTDPVFPHVVRGGGYTTQFILFSRTPGTAPSGTIHLYDQSGNPLNTW